MKKYYPFVLTALTALLALFAMLRSTYLTGGSFPSFAAGLVAVSFILVTVYKLFGSSMALRGMALAAVLSIGNMCAMPMLYYTDGFSPTEVTVMADSTLIGLALACTGAVMAVLGVALLDKAHSRSPNVFTLCLALIAALAAVVIFFFSDASSGTTLILGLQAAIPAAAVMLLAAAAAVGAKKMLHGILCGTAAIALAAAMVLRHETGIPAEVCAALILWYLFFAKRKYKAATAAAVTLPVMAAGGLVFLKFFGSRFEHISLVEKVMHRLYSQNVDHEVSAHRSLAQSGLFGSNAYMYLPEGTSDYSLVTMLHYLGFAFLVLTALAAVPFICLSAKELMKGHSTFSNTLASMSLCLLTVMLIYNLLMSVGAVPVIGVQAPFVGVSKLFSLLSGCLLGWSCCGSGGPEKLANKIKEIRSELV